MEIGESSGGDGGNGGNANVGGEQSDLIAGGNGLECLKYYPRQSGCLGTTAATVASAIKRVSFSQNEGVSKVTGWLNYRDGSYVFPIELFTRAKPCESQNANFIRAKNM